MRNIIVFYLSIMAILLSCSITCNAQSKIRFLVAYNSYDDYSYIVGSMIDYGKTTEVTKFIGFDSIDKVSDWLINNLCKNERWGESDNILEWWSGGGRKNNELVCIYDLKDTKTIPFKQVSDTTIKESRIKINNEFNVKTYFKVE